MSTQFTTQALKEALGDKVFSDATMKQVESRVQEYRKNNLAEGDDLELQLLAVKEVIGTGVLNPNVESQVRSRIRTLNQNPQSVQPGNPNPAPAGGQVSANISPTVGYPNQPQKPATPEEVKQQAGVKQHPEYAEKTRHIGMPQGAQTRGDAQDVSLKEGIEGDINAQQKAQFEKDAAKSGSANSGGANAGGGGSAGGTGGAAGPGAGSANVNQSSNPNSAPAAGTGGTNVGAMGGNSGATGR